MQPHHLAVTPSTHAAISRYVARCLCQCDYGAQIQEEGGCAHQLHVEATPGPCDALEFICESASTCAAHPMATVV